MATVLILLLLQYSMMFPRPVTAQIATECTSGEIRLLTVDNQPEVLYCSNDVWMPMCNGIWTTTEATVACRQLGYSDQGVVHGGGGMICMEPYPRGVDSFSFAMSCNGSENTIQGCGGVRVVENCPMCVEGGRLWCQPACTSGEVRLVGGSTEREGRVEVCVGGHWGTVCNNSQEGVAGAVCSQLGFPAQGATTANTFPPGFVPMSRCTVQNSLSCSQITDASCDHSMDLGVVCPTFEQGYNALLQQCSSTDPPPTSENPTPSPTMCPVVTAPQSCDPIPSPTMCPVKTITQSCDLIPSPTACPTVTTTQSCDPTPTQRLSILPATCPECPRVPTTQSCDFSLHPSPTQTASRDTCNCTINCTANGEQNSTVSASKDDCVCIEGSTTIIIALGAASGALLVLLMGMALALTITCCKSRQAGGPKLNPQPVTNQPHITKHMTANLAYSNPAVITLNDSYKAVEVGQQDEEVEYDTIDNETIDDWKWPNKRN